MADVEAQAPGPLRPLLLRRRLNTGLAACTATAATLLIVVALLHGRGATPGSPDLQATRRELVDDFPPVIEIRDSNTSTGLSSMNTSSSTGEQCKEPYGGLPCSTTVTGNIFLMFAYGFLLLVAAKLISDGSELLLQVLNPGLIGGLLLPILGAFPDSLLIAVSGLGGSKEEAQDQVLVGMGVLAGSTIMILALAFGGSLLFGRCDLSGPNGTAQDRTLTRGWSLTGTGITVDAQTRWGAWIMIITILPYIVAQIPLIDHRKSQGKTAALVGFLIALVGLCAYCVYQVTSPWLQQRKIQHAKLHYMRAMAVKEMHKMATNESWGGLLQPDGGPNDEAMRKLFAHFDENQDGVLSYQELRGLIMGLGIKSKGEIPDEQEVTTWLTDFDRDSDNMLSEDEFVCGLKRWMSRISSQPMQRQNRFSSAIPLIEQQHQQFAGHAEDAKSTLSLLQMEASQDEEDEEEDKEKASKPKTVGQIYRQAIILLGAGVVIVSVFADPTVDAINGFSKASGIPPFFVAFVVSPLASNASELVSSILFAMKRRKRTASLTYSQIYGAITMNNTMCLGIFLVIVYLRGLTWDFSSEVTVIIASTVIVGIIGGTRTTYPLWLAIPVLALYPLAIAVVAILDYVFHWH
eukprot:SM000011S19020  [mRNA]  locus=s11:414121:418397:+ [translate_table: standard]